jgi:hypothetical protein
MAKEYMKKYSTSLAMKEMQIKTALGFHLTPGRMAIIKRTITTTNVGKDVGGKEHLNIVGRNVS